MKIFHLSDLHIGKQLHNYSLKVNQEDILKKIVKKAEELRPDVIVIAGDIYDKSVPSAEAYTIFDDFLNQLSDLRPAIPVLIIAGNHDSAERLRYASGFLKKHHIFISVLPPASKEEYLQKITLNDNYGEVDFYLLPFLKPGYVRHLFEEGIVTSYETAVQAVIERENIDYSRRNILVAHQFFVNGGQEIELSDSEQTSFSVGGIDSVDVSIIDSFDYAALGHIHKAQSVSKPWIRYCGTPLKYSVSEENQEKSITMVTISEKGKEPVVETIPLTPILDVRKEKGLLIDIINRADANNCHDYVSVTITDEIDPYRPKDQLEEVYDNILEILVDNKRTQARLNEVNGETTILSPLAAFEEFFKEMQRSAMSQKEEEIMQEIVEAAREETSE